MVEIKKNLSYLQVPLRYPKNTVAELSTNTYIRHTKKTNQFLNSNRFWVRDKRVQLIIFFFLLHLTQVFVESKFFHVR
jgi:hypothetical protein